MTEQIFDFINGIKTEGKYIYSDEAKTKQGIVLKLLHLLKWDTFNTNEVIPEHSVENKKVDYALRINGTIKVFIEVKKTSEELENHQKQLLEYSFNQGVKIAALTNGFSWWFYLPLNEGSWEQRKFYSINILEQEPEDIAKKFYDFLSRTNIDSGKAIENAEEIYKGKQKNTTLQATLPIAWNKIVDEPNEFLVDLINETAESICGFKADNEMIARFLDKYKEKLVLPMETKKSEKTQKLIISHQNTSITGKINFTGKTPTCIHFMGTRHNVDNWRGVLLTLCALLLKTHGGDFNKVLEIKGRRRSYFSLYKDGLRNPLKIKNTKIYAEGNISANQIYNICCKLLPIFGYSQDNFSIEAI